jgi:Leucine-rich repeat (LRR) protein
MKSDINVFNAIRKLCYCTGAFEEDRCVSLDFTDERSVYTGTIRHFSQTEKQEVLSLMGRLQNLERLNLKKNQLFFLGEYNFPNLKWLDISSNSLDRTPDWLQRCPLEHLDLGANNIEKLPDWLSLLPLKTLKIHKNKISHIPTIRNTLECFNFYLNSIQSVPDFIYDLEHLTYLGFGAVQFREFNGVFKKLEWLSVVLTQLEELPQFLVDCPIKGIRAAKNKIKLLPHNIGDLKRLKHLSLYSNDLVAVPDSFFDLNLQRLDLKKNPMSPSEAARVVNNFSSIEYFQI